MFPTDVKEGGHLFLAFKITPRSWIVEYSRKCLKSVLAGNSTFLHHSHFSQLPFNVFSSKKYNIKGLLKRKSSGLGRGSINHYLTVLKEVTLSFNLGCFGDSGNFIHICGCL